MTDEEYEAIRDGIAQGMAGAIDRIAGWVFMALIGYIIYLLAFNDYDSTDRKHEIGGRSGVELRIDAKTGCHYLESRGGGLTPRLNKKGEHICNGFEDESNQ